MATEKTTNFQNEVFQAIVEQCEGCERIVAVEETKYCGTYVNPGANGGRACVTSPPMPNQKWLW